MIIEITVPASIFGAVALSSGSVKETPSKGTPGGSIELIIGDIICEMFEAFF